MPNPSEMFRKSVEDKNNQLKSFETSRNHNTEHHRLCQEMRESRNRLETGYLCKSDKERLLFRIRELEKLTGFESINYNSSEFNSK